VKIEKEKRGVAFFFLDLSIACCGNLSQYEKDCSCPPLCLPLCVCIYVYERCCVDVEFC
jgi:hypothetical protein